MNTPPEVISMGSPGEYHDPGPNFDLPGQQQAWKDESEPTADLQPNGGYDKLEVKEEDGEEEELEEKGMEEEYERRNEEEEEFSPASSHLSEEEADGDDEDEGHHLDREISAREQVTSGGVHSPKGESEHHGSPREHIHDDVRRREEEEDDDEEEDIGIHEESHTTRNDDDDDHEDSHREMNQGDDEEEDEEDEGEDDDDNDEEDRIKETQKLVAKIEHDIQGLRFQAKQRGHLLSDLHRYGAQHQQRRKEQERLKESAVEQTDDLRMAALPQKPADEGKIIERPVSIKLRLRTRSTSPKAQQERYALSPVVKAKPGKVKMRVLRIGKQLGRWDAWKESLAVKADRDLAKIMMDHMDRTYFQQFLPPPKPDNKGHKRKKRESRKHERKAKKPKQVKVVEEPEEWADGFLDEDDMDDYYDPVEEKNDYDYDPSCESTKFGAYKPSNPVRNKRKSQRPRKLLGVNSSPRASRTTKPTRQPKRSPKAQKDEEQEHTELPVVQKKRGRKPKPKPEVIQTEKKKTPRIHRGGRRPSLMSTLRNLDWNALPRRYECKICCLRFDGIVAFRSHLETTHASEYLKSKEPNNHKPSGEENSNDAQEAEKHFHGSEKPYQESEKQYEDLGHLSDQHSSMQDAEQRRMAESEMYRTMAYGQEMIDARRFEMMPPFKRHLHESFSNEWGKMQGNMYSRPLASSQMIHGEQSWGHNRGYDTIPAYRKHYEDGRDWGKGGGQYPHVITSLGQSMHMGIDGGGGGHREEQHGEGYNMQGGNMLGMEHAPSEESTYVDMSMRHSEENPNQDPEDMSRDRMEGEEQERNEQTQEGEPPPQTDVRSDESDKEAEEEINEQKDDEEEKGDENNDGKKGKRKKTKPYKEWEEIDRWAVTFVHCPQCDDYIRFRPGQKNFHFAVHAERRLCQECGKMFTKEAFRAHVRVHQAKRLGEVLKHICEVCGKGYRFKCSLSSHMRCHTGVRDFDCKICGKKFLSAHGLEKHELVHRKVKPHMCPDCGRGFTQYHNMLAHRRQHTGEKPYRCNICDRSFTHNVSLKNHKKKEHGVDLWAGTGGKPPSSTRQRSKSARSAPVVVSVSPPVPQQPPAPPKPSVPNERELMHTLDPSQLYSMMPTLDYGHY